MKTPINNRTDRLHWVITQDMPNKNFINIKDLTDEGHHDRSMTLGNYSRLVKYKQMLTI